MKRFKLLLATGNNDKIKEIKEILNDLPVEIFTKNDFKDFPEVEEDTSTLEGNASKKALEIAQKYNMHTIADDTGFFVSALNGAPGIYAARYAGENCSYQDNRNKLLREMKDKTDRNAYFETVVAFASPDKIIAISHGKVNGKITEHEKGKGKFGYDPIFMVEDTGKTFAEMDSAQKNKVSHRARALQKMKENLKEYYKTKWMASELNFVQYVAEQMANAGEITYKKMFGEYGEQKKRAVYVQFIN